MENRQLNEKQSLDLIAKMIQNTQQRLEKGSGIPFLVWGYTTILVSLTIWYLVTKTADYRWHYLWYMIPVVGTPVMFALMRRREKGVKTYIDKVIGHIWLVLGIVGLLASSSTIFLWQQWNLPILFIIILMMGSGTAMTGLIIRFRPLAIAGFMGIVLSFACMAVKGSDQILVFAAIFLVMMVIPGHILYKKGKKE